MEIAKMVGAAMLVIGGVLTIFAILAFTGFQPPAVTAVKTQPSQALITGLVAVIFGMVLVTILMFKKR
jgi:hypothetical protein